MLLLEAPLCAWRRSAPPPGRMHPPPASPVLTDVSGLTVEAMPEAARVLHNLRREMLAGRTSFPEFSLRLVLMAFTPLPRLSSFHDGTGSPGRVKDILRLPWRRCFPASPPSSSGQAAAPIGSRERPSLSRLRAVGAQGSNRPTAAPNCKGNGHHFPVPRPWGPSDAPLPPSFTSCRDSQARRLCRAASCSRCLWIDKLFAGRVRRAERPRPPFQPSELWKRQGVGGR